MKLISCLLILTLLSGPLWAVTDEVTTPEVIVLPDLSHITVEVEPVSYWQEVDIVFWQTLPFAVLWTHLLERQFSSRSEANWDLIIGSSTFLSFWNGVMQAQRVTRERADERTGRSH